MKANKNSTYSTIFVDLDENLLGLFIAISIAINRLNLATINNEETFTAKTDNNN